MPAAILSALASADDGRPALIHHDDTPGPTQGERIELSRRVLRTWVAKAANLLQEGLDVTPGTVVRLDLPAPHWRALYWAYAVWSVGATLTLDDHEGADVLITADPHSALLDDADAVVVVSLPALARALDGDVPSGAVDEAAEIASYADSFEAWEDIDADDVALVTEGTRITYADLVPEPRATEERVLLTPETGGDVGALLTESLRTFAAGGSLAWARGTDATAGPENARWLAEGVTTTA